MSFYELADLVVSGLGSILDEGEIDDTSRSQLMAIRAAFEAGLRTGRNDDYWTPERRTADRIDYQNRIAASEVWRTMIAARREALVLEVLGDEHLTVQEVHTRIGERLRTPACGTHSIVTDTSIRGLLLDMVDGGQLNRRTEPRGKRAVRYRYFRRSGLDGPIADLERAFNDHPEQA